MGLFQSAPIENRRNGSLLISLGGHSANLPVRIVLQTGVLWDFRLDDLRRSRNS